MDEYSDWRSKDRFNKMMSPYYNTNNTCDECGNKLIRGNSHRELNKNRDWTGRWLCQRCYDKKRRPPIREKTKIYNLNNICDICGDKLIKGKVRKEYKEGEWTGRWLCSKCSAKEHYYHEIAYITDFRNNCLDPNSPPGKGYISQQITCKTRGIKDLNIENNNFNYPIDHSIDQELGIIQSKGSKYYSTYGTWHSTWANEHEKDFDNLILYCMSEDTKNVERVYIFPWEEVLKRTNVTIYKNSQYGWYEKYRVDEKPYNDAYHNILEEIEKGNDPVIDKKKII